MTTERRADSMRAKTIINMTNLCREQEIENNENIICGMMCSAFAFMHHWIHLHRQSIVNCDMVLSVVGRTKVITPTAAPPAA